MAAARAESPRSSPARVCLAWLSRQREEASIAHPRTFPELLKHWRLDRGYKQEALAIAAGLSKNWVGRLERGERPPGAFAVFALAKALDLAGADRDAFVGSVIGHVDRTADAERVAAWELYVELVTRTALCGLPPDEGLLREALDSLHTLFETARAVLRAHGPDIAVTVERAGPTVASLAAGILNRVLRPVLTKWHPLLLDYEQRIPEGVTAMEHERAWTRYQELRGVLATIQADLAVYAKRLADLAGIPHPLEDAEVSETV